MMNIRVGTKNDLPAILGLIQELADYEKASEEVQNSVEQMEIDGFGAAPIFKFFVAENENRIVGTAIFYNRYSTWKGRCLYLEDLVVSESERGQGTGKLLFDAIVKEAKTTDCKVLTWQVLDWNEPAIRFYKRLNADLDEEWINCKLTDEQIQNY
jgi:GNAT superfamily N-acetyltransferase